MNLREFLRRGVNCMRVCKLHCRDSTANASCSLAQWYKLPSYLGLSPLLPLCVAVCLGDVTVSVSAVPGMALWWQGGLVSALGWRLYPTSSGKGCILKTAFRTSQQVYHTLANGFAAHASSVLTTHVCTYIRTTASTPRLCITETQTACDSLTHRAM